MSAAFESSVSCIIMLYIHSYVVTAPLAVPKGGRNRRGQHEPQGVQYIGTRSPGEYTQMLLLVDHDRHASKYRSQKRAQIARSSSFREE